MLTRSGEINRLLRVVSVLCCPRCITWFNESEFPEGVHAITAPSFGTPERRRLHGKSNLQIAAIVERIRDKHKEIPLVVQRELEGLIKNGPANCVLLGYDTPNVYGFFATLRKKNPTWKTVICITHPDHLWLCAAVAKNFEFTLCVPRSVSSIPYDRRSAPRGARSRIECFLYERISAALMAWNSLI